MARFLIATWDGAGNLVPTLGLARMLVDSGHEVRVLGHRSIDERCGRGGWRFEPLQHAPEFDSAARGAEDDMAAVARRLWFDGAIARDVLDALDREPAVVIGDCLLFTALSAAQAAGMPTVALFHGAFTLFRRGPLFDLLTTMLPSLNRVRSSLALPEVARITDVHDACALSLVASPREFEPAAPLPANVHHVGPFVEAPTRGVPDRDAHAASLPRILVSFSTSDQGHAPVLQRVVDALATVSARVTVTTGPAIDPAALRPAPNVAIVRFAPHASLLPTASLVVTHAGLGTVMAALAHAVPLLCIPIGRDQFFNAARVEALGAGRTLPRDADTQAIARVAREMIADAAAREAAERMAATIARYEGARGAVALIERMLSVKSAGEQPSWHRPHRRTIVPVCAPRNSTPPGTI